VIGSEDQLMLISSKTDTSVNSNICGFGSVAAINFTAVNMQNSSVNNIIQSSGELLIELHCQQNAGSGHNDRQRALRGAQTALQVLDHGKGLATTSGAIDATLGGSLQHVKDTLLVGAELHVLSHQYLGIIAQKNPAEAGP